MQEQHLMTQIGILSESLKNLQMSVNALSSEEDETDENETTPSTSSPKFSGKQTTNQNIAFNTSTVVEFNADIDTNNSFNSSTNKYIIPEQGTYFISTCIAMNVTYPSNVPSVKWTVFINKNGTIISKGYIATDGPGIVDDNGSRCVTTLVNLAVNDEIQITISGGHPYQQTCNTIFEGTNLSIIKF